MMLSRPGIFRPFSHPGIASDGAMYAEIARTCADLAAAAAEGLSRQAEGATDLRAGVERWAATERSLHANWRATVSKAGRYAREGETRANDDRMARLLLDAPDPDPHWLRHIGKDGPPVLIDDRLAIATATGVRETAVARVGAIRIVEVDQTAEAVCADSHIWLPVDPDRVGRHGRDAVIRDALALLDEIAPQEALWITRILDLIVMIPGMTDRTCSGSWADAAGTIYCSEPASPVEAAEVLVHEASHQYFHMLETLGSTKNDDERGEYYSPPVQRNRPLDRILIAYHAFANVLTFYEKAFAHGLVTDRRTINRYEAFADDVAALAAHLERSDGLSLLGRAVYEPLRQVREEATPVRALAG